MTHEREPNDEAGDGPEFDDRLPDAAEIPVGDDPDDVEPMTNPEDWD